MIMKVNRSEVKTINFTNVGKDFKQEFVLRGFTKSGRMKLTEINGEGPDGITLGKNKLTKIRDGVHWVRESGSPLNSYYYEMKDN